MPRDLRNPRWMYLKAIGFVVIGVLACAILLLRNADVQTLLLISLAIWAFCRAYYFAFYVIEHYIDPTYKFAGLVDFAKYLFVRRPSHCASLEGEAPAEPLASTAQTARQEPRPPARD